MKTAQKSLFILTHQGLGDLLICNGIFRECAKKRKKVFIAAKKSNAYQVKAMLKDVANISILIVPDLLEDRIFRLISILAPLKFDVLRLGIYGSNFVPLGIRFDKSFYDQAGVSLELRWDNFICPRDLDKEQLLYTRLVRNLPYIFLHEDQMRGMVINRNLIATEFHVVEPLPRDSSFTIFDYLKIIENASEIHVIESSFAHLIESVGVKGNKFAHRYTRPLVTDNFSMTPTYRHDWHVIK